MIHIYKQTDCSLLDTLLSFFHFAFVSLTHLFGWFQGFQSSPQNIHSSLHSLARSHCVSTLWLNDYILNWFRNSFLFELNWLFIIKLEQFWNSSWHCTLLPLQQVNIANWLPNKCLFCCLSKYAMVLSLLNCWCTKLSISICLWGWESSKILIQFILIGISKYFKFNIYTKFKKSKYFQ